MNRVFRGVTFPRLYQLEKLGLKSKALWPHDIRGKFLFHTASSLNEFIIFAKADARYSSHQENPGLY